MLNNLKALVVVLALAWAVFYLARPLCVRYMSAETFLRRRNVWFALTAVAFLSPVFWGYALFAIVLLSWAGARDENPMALYMWVLFAVPNASYSLPTVLVNQFFDLTQYRLLSLVIIIPMMVRQLKDPSRSQRNQLRLADWLLVGFLTLQVLQQFPYESVTATMRRSFLLFIDTFVVFYAFSRLTDRNKLTDLLVSFWLACAVMAPIGAFEWAKGWLLYTGLSSVWGDPNIFAFIFRGGGLRAQAAAGHSLSLGYVLAVALGFFLYLRGRSQRSSFDWMVFATFAFGMYATGSRGSWVMAMLVVLVFVMFRPGAARKLVGASALGALIVAGMYFTPLKEAVIDRLPIIGTSDQDTVLYRQQLYDTSMPLIRQNPLFGDPFVTRNMESLRQGQGIIDIVNGYLFTALFHGIVGLFLQMGALTLGLWQATSVLLRIRSKDIDGGTLGASLVAVFIGTLFFIATAGFGPPSYMVAGLLLSYAWCMQHSASTSAPQVAVAPQRLRNRGLA